VLIIRRSNCINTASGIVLSVSDRPVCDTGRSLTESTIPDAQPQFLPLFRTSKPRYSCFTVILKHTRCMYSYLKNLVVLKGSVIDSASTCFSTVEKINAVYCVRRCWAEHVAYG